MRDHEAVPPNNTFDPLAARRTGAECGRQPRAPLAPMSLCIPEFPKRRAGAPKLLVISVLGPPTQRHPEVVLLKLQPIEPRVTTGTVLFNEEESGQNLTPAAAKHRK